MALQQPGLEDNLPDGEPKKLSRKQWRAHVRKLKRRLRCQSEAQENEAETPEPCGYSQRPEDKPQWVIEQEEKQREWQNQLWLERERRAQIEWQAKKEQEEKERIRREEQERKIREEWEEQERKEKEEEEARKKAEDEKKDRQDALLKEARANERKDGSWHNPLAPPQHPGIEREIEKCPFFVKTGACRFGDRCSRAHDYPESSCTILFPNMYSHFGLEQGMRDEYDTDLNLEYSDKDTYLHFREFYDDVLPEFKEVGRVVQFKVSCNHEPHLRGNVYIQYKREEEAAAAFVKFNGRWYAGKQLSCQFTNVTKWKAAICGLYNRNRCPKGNSCNFLHVFRNPGNEYWEADQDYHLYQRSGSHYSQRDSRHENSYRDFRSMSRRSMSSRYSRSRSRSKSPRSRRNRSPSRKSHRKQRSRSKSPIRRHRSRSRSRSRSPSVKSKHRDHSRSRSGSPSRSFSKHKKKRDKDSTRMQSEESVQGESPGSSRSSSASSSPDSHHKRKHKKHKKHKKSKRHKKSHGRGIANQKVSNPISYIEDPEDNTDFLPIMDRPEVTESQTEDNLTVDSADVPKCDFEVGPEIPLPAER